MSLYVEIMCDVLAEGTRPGSALDHLCWTNGGNNPQGWSVGTARKEAKSQGWKRIGEKDICPGCQTVEQGQ